MKVTISKILSLRNFIKSNQGISSETMEVMQANTVIQTTAFARNYLNDTICIITRSLYSPDLNLIETVWSAMNII